MDALQHFLGQNEGQASELEEIYNTLKLLFYGQYDHHSYFSSYLEMCLTCNMAFL